jgi:hypothetical protein
VTPRRELILAAASLWAALMSAPLLSQPKRLRQMNRLEDVGPFPGGGLDGSNDQCDGLMLAIPAYAVELFRYRGAAKDGGTLEYTLWNRSTGRSGD